MVSKSKYIKIEDSDSDSPPPQYEVDRILATRKRRGKTQYLIKWVGYSSEHNSWEPEENLSDDLIASNGETNEETTGKRAEQNGADEPATLNGNDEPNISPSQLQSGAEDSDASDSSGNEGDADNSGHERYKFEQGFSLLKILAAKLVDGELMFLFQYENSDYGEFVPSKIANVRFPQDVIRFYEGITLWID